MGCQMENELDDARRDPNGAEEDFHVEAMASAA